MEWRFVEAHLDRARRAMEGRGQGERTESNAKASRCSASCSWRCGPHWLGTFSHRRLATAIAGTCCCHMHFLAHNMKRTRADETIRLRFKTCGSALVHAVSACRAIAGILKAARLRVPLEVSAGAARSTCSVPCFYSGERHHVSWSLLLEARGARIQQPQHKMHGLGVRSMWATRCVVPLVYTISVSVLHLPFRADRCPSLSGRMPSAMRAQCRSIRVLVGFRLTPSAANAALRPSGSIAPVAVWHGVALRRTRMCMP